MLETWTRPCWLLLPLIVAGAGANEAGSTAFSLPTSPLYHAQPRPHTSASFQAAIMESLMWHPPTVGLPSAMVAPATNHTTLGRPSHVWHSGKHQHTLAMRASVMGPPIKPRAMLPAGEQQKLDRDRRANIRASNQSNELAATVAQRSRYLRPALASHVRR